MALGLIFGGGTAGDGESLLSAFTKINSMFLTTTKLGNGDMVFGRDGGITVGKGGGTSYGATALGQDALANATGQDNTAVGWSALNAISSGGYNTAVGSNAMKNATSTATFNTAVGVSALKASAGGSNVAIGSGAMEFSSTTNASNNTAVGASALQSTTGANNTAVGSNVLRSNTSGYENIAVGASALQTNTIGYYNVAIGVSSQSTSLATIGNTSLGSFSLYNANTGNQNTAIGYGTLEKNQSGVSNAALGYAALNSNTTGSNNVGLGTGTLFQNQTKSNNTAVGTNALYFNNSLYTNCTGLGYNSNVSADNQIRLGDTSITAVVSQVGSFSDIRDKADIRDTVLGLDFVNSLRPVDYKWDYREDYRPEMPTPLELDATEEEKDAHKIIMDEWSESCKLSNLVKDGSKKRTRYHHGLIAQEVQDLIEESGVDFGGFQDHTFGGGDDVMTVSYMELIAPMIKAIQELTARINVLEGN